MEVHGAPRRLHEGIMEISCRSPWRSVEAPWRLIVTSVELHGASMECPIMYDTGLLHRKNQAKNGTGSVFQGI